MTWILDVTLTIVIINVFKVLQENIEKWVNKYGNINQKTETIEVLDLKNME